MLGTMRILALLVVAFGFAGVTGCASPVATPLASPTGPLVTVETRGGECAAGPCGQTITIDRDGRVHLAAKPPNELGQLTPDVLRNLERLIATTDFGAIKSHPFTGECPTAYDGQETIYTFSAPGGVETIASCTVVVDPSLPLFAALDAVVSAAGRP
jgi:hypothetical protein